MLPARVAIYACHPAAGRGACVRQMPEVWAHVRRALLFMWEGGRVVPHVRPDRTAHNNVDLPAVGGAPKGSREGRA